MKTIAPRPPILFFTFLPFYLFTFISFFFQQLLSHEEREAVYVLQSDASTPCHAVERVLSDVERNVDFVSETLVESAQQRTATAQLDNVFHDVRIKLRRSVLKS